MTHPARSPQWYKDAGVILENLVWLDVLDTTNDLEVRSASARRRTRGTIPAYIFEFVDQHARASLFIQQDQFAEAVQAVEFAPRRGETVYFAEAGLHGQALCHGAVVGVIDDDEGVVFVAFLGGHEQGVALVDHAVTTGDDVIGHGANDGAFACLKVNADEFVFAGRKRGAIAINGQTVDVTEVVQTKATNFDPGVEIAIVTVEHFRGDAIKCFCARIGVHVVQAWDFDELASGLLEGVDFVEELCRLCKKLTFEVVVWHTIAVIVETVADFSARWVAKRVVVVTIIATAGLIQMQVAILVTTRWDIWTIILGHVFWHIRHVGLVGHIRHVGLIGHVHREDWVAHACRGVVHFPFEALDVWCRILCVVAIVVFDVIVCTGGQSNDKTQRCEQGRRCTKHEKALSW